jgi:diguanylate cyclase (GGDEF)-like protein/PAS domain S-box-containing protein
VFVGGASASPEPSDPGPEPSGSTGAPGPAGPAPAGADPEPRLLQPAEPEAEGAGDLDPAVARLLLDRTAHPFVIVDPEGYITYAGSSMVDVLGWDPAAAIGHHMVEFLAPDSVELAARGLQEINELNMLAVGVPMVFELLHKDGHTVCCEVGALTLPSEFGFQGIALRLRPWDAQFHFDRFVKSLLGSDPLDQVCEHLTSAIAADLQASGAVVHHGFDGHAFGGAAGVGIPIASLSPSAGPWQRTALTGEAQSATVDELPADAAEAAAALGLHQVWTVPVDPTEGLAPAVLSVWRRETGQPLLGHTKVLERSATYVQLALLRWAEHQRLVHLAGHDALTGVANRTNFRDRLAHALAIGERDLAVAFCDLDGFKAINDTYGHQTGDDVLVAVAERLRASLRTGDELARIGGDEFTLLLRNVPDGPAAMHVADRLLAACVEPFIAARRLVNVGISIGIALVRPGTSADQLLALADAALYEVKRSGGRAAQVVDPDA